MSFRNIILVFFYGILFTQCSSEGNKQPKRHKDIPSEAIWYGGTDGGSWIKIESTNKSNYFDVSVYFESTGELWEEGRFKVCDDCFSTSFKVEDIKKMITSFDGSVIVLSELNKEKYCTLNSVISND